LGNADSRSASSGNRNERSSACGMRSQSAESCSQRSSTASLLPRPTSHGSNFATSPEFAAGFLHAGDVPRLTRGEVPDGDTDPDGTDPQDDDGTTRLPDTACCCQWFERRASGTPDGFRTRDLRLERAVLVLPVVSQQTANSARYLRFRKRDGTGRLRQESDDILMPQSPPAATR
jgi:hypothetical protein